MPPSGPGSGVRLATMHRVKGLEFPHVRLVGVNRGVIPYLPNELDLDPVEYEETELRERCLLHVAASRARNTLVVTSYGQASPFIDRESKRLGGGTGGGAQAES